MERLKTTFAVETESQDTWWACVTTRLEPGNIKGSRYSLKGGVELNLKARKILKSDVLKLSLKITK